MPDCPLFRGEQEVIPLPFSFPDKLSGLYVEVDHGRGAEAQGGELLGTLRDQR